MFKDLLGMLRRGGRYATAGAIGGPLTQIDLRELIYKDLEMHGITNPTAETFARVVRLIEQGELIPQLDGKYELQVLPEAQARLLKRTHVGKLVIVP
jgi:NADPH:quinone reductase-like Zn-dependent oxidoreductase